MIGLSASFSEAPSPNKITAHPIMEILEANLFVNVDSLLTNIVMATKSPDGLIDWIELKPEFHGSLVKCVLRLVSRHAETLKTASAKEALFPFLINLLNGREAHTTLFHKKKTATASKRANRERKCVPEKLKVHIDDMLEKSKVNVNDAADKKTPPVRALSSSEGIHPPPDPAIITSATLPPPINHPPADPKANPQAQDPVVDKLEAEESGCRGIHTHPMCEECHNMPAAGLKFNRYPKCVVDRHKDGEYIDGYEDYPCYCAEDYAHWRESQNT
ncbi:hypothetical protein M405DRAFT_869667 [Rhizopogon salebrosus TDB-379]|nr:hypothetical protein M405DRAFT_869667 [Rhizopogon salebrosus TDB-379]